MFCQQRSMKNQNNKICMIVRRWLMSVKIVLLQGKCTKFRNFTKCRKQSSLHNDGPHCGLWPHYTLMGASRPSTPLHSDWTLCGLRPHYTMMGCFAAHFWYLVHFRNYNKKWANFKIQKIITFIWLVSLIPFQTFTIQKGIKNSNWF